MGLLRTVWFLACALLACLTGSAALSAGFQDPPSAPDRSDLTVLETRLLKAKEFTDAYPLALEIITHPDRARAGKRIQALLRTRKELPALSLLKAMETREIAWLDTVPGVLTLLGNGSPKLVEASRVLVQRVWMKPGIDAGQACLAQVAVHLGKTEKRSHLELRGAVYLAGMLKRVENIRPLIALLERHQDLDRGTRMCIAEALEAITLDPRFGMDAARWKAWAQEILKPDMTREQLLEANWAAVHHENTEFLKAQLKTSITALGESELKVLERFLHTPYPGVFMAAAQHVSELYKAVTDLGERKKVQIRVLPMLLETLNHHHEAVVAAALEAVAMLSRPALERGELSRNVRRAVMDLLESSSYGLQLQSIQVLSGYVDPEAGEEAARLQKLLESSVRRPSEFRVALVNTLGAYGREASVDLFRCLTESDPDEAVRMAAAIVFLKIKPVAAIETLSRILESKAGATDTLRRRFVGELGNAITKHPAVIKPLVNCLEKDGDPEVLVICAGSLGYAQGTSQVRLAGEALRSRLKASPGGGEPKLAACLVTSLGRLGFRDACDDLIPLLDHGDPVVKEKTREALIHIAVLDVKRTRAFLSHLLDQNIAEPVVAAYHRLTRNTEKNKQLNELDKSVSHGIDVLFLRALLRTENPKNLQEALTKVQDLRKVHPRDAELMVLEARALGLYLLPRAKEVLAFQKANRLDTENTAWIHEWKIIAAWAQMRLGERDPVPLFRAIYDNGELNPEEPLAWSYLVGLSLALLNQDPERNRAKIETHLARIPGEAFQERAPAWLKVQLDSIRSVLKAPAKKPEKKPEK